MEKKSIFASYNDHVLSSVSKYILLNTSGHGPSDNCSCDNMTGNPIANQEGLHATSRLISVYTLSATLVFLKSVYAIE